jgi:hypothetical protein
MMPTTQEQEIIELGPPTVDPVLYVMGIAVLETAAREPASPVSMGEGPPDRRGNSAGFPANI